VAISKRALLVKVPEITLIFWIAKIMSTLFGEVFSDYIFFNDVIGRNRAILMGLGLLTICLVVQFATTRYVPWVYWLAVTAVSIFGTMSADFLNKDLGMPLWASTLMLLVLQAAVFVAWYLTERTLDIHSVDSYRREAFYWATVLLTFALGTAAGDYAAGPLGLGTFASGLLFLVIILAPAVGYRWFHLNAVFAFWFAYTITRPLGASFGDWLAVPAPFGDGLQLGTDRISLYSGIAMLAIIAFIDIRYRQASKAVPVAVVADPDPDPAR
jgi:uncharacterized membrane-anchored protein